MPGRSIIAVSTLCLSLVSSSIGAIAQAVSRENLSGAWQLESAVFIAADGTRIDSFGPNPVGRITLTSDGTYSLIILRADLPKVASNNRLQATPEENKAIVTGSVAHFGSYDVSGNSISLKIGFGTFPNTNGSEQKRDIVDFTNDSWKWVVNERGGQSVNQWKRVK